MANNNIIPVIESDFSSLEKLDSVYSFLENERLFLSILNLWKVMLNMTY